MIDFLGELIPYQFYLFFAVVLFVMVPIWLIAHWKWCPGNTNQIAYLFKFVIKALEADKIINMFEYIWHSITPLFQGQVSGNRFDPCKGFYKMISNIGHVSPLRRKIKRIRSVPRIPGRCELKHSLKSFIRRLRPILLGCRVLKCQRITSYCPDYSVVRA